LSACKAAGVPGRLRHDFRRTACRNLERAGVSRSAAMAMVGHKTQAIYSRYAIADEASLKEAAVKLATFHETEKLSTKVL
jgi:integrase